MIYHDFKLTPRMPTPAHHAEPLTLLVLPLRSRCAECGKSRMSAFHFMPDNVDRDMSKRIRELPKEAWRIGGKG